MKRVIVFAGVPVFTGLLIAACSVNGELASTQQPTTTGASLSFEVASIKPTRSKGGVSGGDCHGVDSKYNAATLRDAAPLGRCVYQWVNLKSLIYFAYRKPSGEYPAMIGGDPWVDSDEFDVEAKADDPSHTTEAQLQLMVQTMLRDEFKLQIHIETHEQQGFALVRMPNGPALKEFADLALSPGAKDQAPPSGTVTVPDGAGKIMKARAMSGTRIAQLVGGNLGHPVVDKTGLTGLYDFTLTWTPTVGDRIGGATAASSDNSSGPTFVTALREQLGLRLEPQKVPVEVLVIDHAEKPTPN